MTLDVHKGRNERSLRIVQVDFVPCVFPHVDELHLCKINVNENIFVSIFALPLTVRSLSDISMFISWAVGVLSRCLHAMLAPCIQYSWKEE